MIEGLLWACSLLGGFLIVMFSADRLGLPHLALRSPIGIFLITHLLNVIGAAIVLSIRSGPPELRTLFLSTIVIATLSPLLGAWLTAEFLRMRPEETLAFLRQPSQLRLPGMGYLMVVVLALGTAAILWVVLWERVGTLPLVAGLTGAATGTDLTALRAATYKTVPQALTHPMNALRLGVLPFLLCAAVARVCWRRGSREVGVLLPLLLLAALYNAYSSALYPVALLFVLLGLSWYYLKTLSFRKALVTVGGGMAFPLFWGAVVLLDRQPLGAALVFEVRRHMDRFLYDVPDAIWSYVELYSGPRGHLLGGAQRPLALLFGQPLTNAPNEVFLYRDPGGFALGNATAPYEATFFADFGLWGVLVGGLLVGIVLQAVHALSVRAPLNELTFARFVLICWGGYSMTMSSAFTGFLSKGILFALVLAPTLGTLVGRAEGPSRNADPPPRRGILPSVRGRA